MRKKIVKTEKTPEESARRSRARDSLVEATKRLLAHGVLPGVTVDDILREAGVARSSFYNHFISVADLIEHTVSSVQEELYARINMAQADNPNAGIKLARGIVTVIRFGYEHRASARVLMYTGPSVANPASPGNVFLTENLEDGLKEGIFKFPGLDAAVVCVLGICELGLSRMLDLHHEYSQVRDLTRDLSISVLRCLGVDARRIDAMVQDAMKNCFDASPESQSKIV